MADHEPLLVKKREHPPEWADDHLELTSSGRPKYVEKRKPLGIMGHIMGTVRLLFGWFWFLVIINAIGILLYVISDSVRNDTKIAGSACLWWAIFFDVAIFGWYITKLIVKFVYGILYALKFLRFIWYLASPFSNRVNGIVWTVALAAVHLMILDAEESRLESGARDRFEKIFAALVAIFIILIIKRAALLICEVLLYREHEQLILDTESWNELMEPIAAADDSEKSAVDKLTGWSINVLPPGLIGQIKLVKVVEKICIEGFHPLDYHLPYGDDKSRIPRSVLYSETRHVHKALWKALGNKSSLSLEDIEAALDGNDAFAKLVHSQLRPLGTDETASVTEDSALAGVEALLLKRRSNLALFNGRKLLVNVIDDLLSIIAGFVILLFLLNAFDVDLLPLLVPSGTIILAGAFISAPILRDFIASMYLIFFMRPFDIGDVITVDAGQCPGEQLLVKRTKVMTTHFRNQVGDKIYLTNAVISASKIHNLSRLKKPKPGVSSIPSLNPV